jgi:hypothetical protein
LSLNIYCYLMLMWGFSSKGSILLSSRCILSVLLQHLSRHTGSQYCRRLPNLGTSGQLRSLQTQ